MNGIFKIDKNFIELVFKRVKESIEDGRAFEKNKKDCGLPSNELLIEKISDHLSTDLVETLIETCFVSSLEKEEGRLYNFSVSLIHPECQQNAAFIFKTPIDFSPATLAKLAPALNPNYYSINLWLNTEGGLEMWGFSEKKYPYFSLSTSSPGKVIIDCAIGLERRFKAFVSMAEVGIVSLKSTSNPVADWLQRTSTKEQVPAFFSRNSDLGNLLMQVFLHGNGGTLVLVPQATEEWMNSIQQPILYGGANTFLDKRIKEKYSTMENYAKERMKGLEGSTDEEIINSLLTTSKPNKELSSKLSINEHEAKLALFNISDLTKVDGATVITQNFEVLAFGARIQPVDANKKPANIAVIIPFEAFSDTERRVSLSEIGGTRHQSAAQFVYDQKNCIAVVASHDGRLSVLWWSEEKNSVMMMMRYEAMIG